MKDLIRESAKDRILIAAHRGVAGGNIPCNTEAAFEAALYQGADILELDIERSLDGELFILHPGMEMMHLRSRRPITTMTAKKVKKLRYHNFDGTATQEGLMTLDEALEAFGHRCFINLDKFWSNIDKISQTVRRHNLQDRVIAKSAPKKKAIDMLEQVAPDIPFLHIIRKEDNITDELLKRDIRLIGAEVLFEKEDEELADPAYIKKMQDQGLLLWVNSILYNYKSILAAGFTDDVSVTGKPDEGWGRLAQMGYNIIQTDWVLPLRLYLEEKGYNKNK
ncbi:MAG: glycerophosphodiester phosphodiesterase family protein [Clostridiales bacterium]|nr:glycerophosphodiester phosphodiesterase family protein [Clostridiales bacterium]